jgi:hypothetical protein
MSRSVEPIPSSPKVQSPVVDGSAFRAFSPVSRGIPNSASHFQMILFSAPALGESARLAGDAAYERRQLVYLLIALWKTPVKHDAGSLLHANLRIIGDQSSLFGSTLSSPRTTLHGTA